jgi:hemerythrin
MLVWTKDLSVGVIEIDDQHRELFDRINRLLSAIDEQAAADEIQNLFTFLESYVVKHFGDEERYMDHYEMRGYSDSARHKSEHLGFVNYFREFRADFEAATPSHQFVTEFTKWMTNWWMIHIQHIDKGLGAFLKTVFPMLGH